ncbi:hypothetical protein [Trinickia sp. EG282A]|uniref:hypothetical protein n=1 Tax=Trinickia sp. EG282A TaxID=3237013 RepID=UPI0034D2CA99
MSTEPVTANMVKRSWLKRAVCGLLAGVTVVACFAAANKNEAIDEAGLVMNYFRSFFGPNGTATTETNPDN